MKTVVTQYYYYSDPHAFQVLISHINHRKNPKQTNKNIKEETHRSYTCSSHEQHLGSEKRRSLKMSLSNYYFTW